MMEDGSTRANLWRSTTLNMEETQEEVRQEVLRRRDAWVAARDTGRNDYVLSEIYLCWGARAIVSVIEEWEIRMSGLDRYLEMWSARALPWQKVWKHLIATAK